MNTTDQAYARIVQLNDERTATSMAKQVKDPESRFDGGVFDDTVGIAQANHVSTVSDLISWISSYVNPDSAHYHSIEVAERINRAVAFLLRRQHKDGTISLGSTNYHSPPDTAFIIVGLLQVHPLMKKDETSAIRPVCEGIETFLRRAVPAMRIGGCHTPNHRWVMTAALGGLHQLFPEEEGLVERAEEWLAEGLDFTEDGEFSERSNGIYNAVNDIMLYYAALYLNRPELLEPVRRNLNMMVYLTHPNGEVVTDYSGRQDFGNKATFVNYFLIYRLMAVKDGNGLFASMSDEAAKAMTHPGSSENQAMAGLLMYPDTQYLNVPRQPLPEQYEVMLNEHHPYKEQREQLKRVGHHGIVQHSAVHSAYGHPVGRYRDGKESATLMAAAPSFFSLRYGAARLLAVKWSTAMTPGIVAMDSLKKEAGSYHMKATLEKGYNGPLPTHARGKDSTWSLMPHQLRPLTHVQTHEVQVDIEHMENGWEFNLKAGEPEDVFTQITFLFSAEGELKGNGLQQTTNPQQFLWKNGDVTYESGQDRMILSGAAQDHTVELIRTDAHPLDCLAISINLLTPFEHRIRLTLEERKE
ncbi:hypothetical protein [Aureibacillus halotolerans]|uniref:Heparinase II/III-like protein n=1 Tax=Aureibacillus halotolerans TaxID=1508390 RepID=A0A4R6TU03_9BACI|nr:hypothetical protein [Aureibacillus halotolerans]TDQ37188.1 hypothetical protein EV213_11467 [Aureibacillus halotolerans]